MEKPEIEEQTREQGIKRAVNFLLRLDPENKLTKPETLIDWIGKLDYKSYQNFLKRLNGIIRDIKPAERKGSEYGSAVALSYGEKKFQRYVAPIPQAGEQFMKMTFENIKKLAIGDHPDKNQVIARSVFNSLIYIHPFKDANGRTARLAYFLFSPHFKKEKSTIEKDLVNVMSDRGHPDMLEYIIQVDYGYFSHEIEKRGVDAEFDEKAGFFAHMKYDDFRGFDQEHLKFIAALDVLSQEEKEEYAHKSKKSNAFYLVENELPEEIVQKIDDEHEVTRVKFVRYVLEGSWNPDEEWPEDFISSLDKSIRPSRKGNYAS